MPEKDNGGVKRMEWNRFALCPAPPAARSCMHTITHKTWREMKLVVLPEYPHPRPQTLVHYRRRGPHWRTAPPFRQRPRRHMSHLLSGGDLQRKHICISAPAASSCISPKLISWAVTFVFVFRRWFDTTIITPAPMRPPPPNSIKYNEGLTMVLIGDNNCLQTMQKMQNPQDLEIVMRKKAGD